MKKIAPIAAIALICAFAMTSCKKKWTCECVTTTNGVSSTVSLETTKLSKSDAKKACNELDEEETTVGTITTKSDCSIK